jgi:diguanylate cyclase (GGDEF)-like protein
MKRISTNSLAFNIAGIVLLASSVALGTYAIALMEVDRVSSLAALDSQLATLADVIGQNSTAAIDFGDRRTGQEILEALRQEGQIVSGCLYDRSGSLFAGYQRDAGRAPCSSGNETQAAPGKALRRISRTVYRRNERVGTILLIADTVMLQHRERRLMQVAVGLALISLLLGVAAGLVLQRRVTRPILELAGAMRAVCCAEALNERVEPCGSEEIRELGSGFNHMIAQLRERDRRTRRAEATLQQQARRDSLTGLPNRRAFMERLSDALTLSDRDGTLVGLLYVDLDGFKLVNDSLGHTVGDLLLKRVGARFASRVRVSDTLARVGGDEFTLVLPGLQTAEDAGRVAAALLDCLRTPFEVSGHEITVGCSIGISLRGESSLDSHDLLQQADSAMYAAKRGGRNRAVYFSPELGLMARERLTLENELRSALARGEIYVDYQPEFELSSGRLKRFEALARWKHAALGQVPPDKFIPVAEECGLIHTIGAYILETACREAASWQTNPAEPIELAVNVSAVQFNSEGLPGQVAEVLKRTGLPPECLQLELTESAMLGSNRACVEKMMQLRNLGVTLAIDDFGTGYSSLSYLAELPVNTIKTDRSFLRGIETTEDGEGIIGSMIELAHRFRICVVVEGIETVEQLAVVRGLGADEGQGFLLGRPERDAAEQIRRYAQPRAESGAGAAGESAVAEQPARRRQGVATAESAG